MSHQLQTGLVCTVYIVCVVGLLWRLTVHDHGSLNISLAWVKRLDKFRTWYTQTVSLGSDTNFKLIECTIMVEKLYLRERVHRILI